MNFFAALMVTLMTVPSLAQFPNADELKAKAAAASAQATQEGQKAQTAAAAKADGGKADASAASEKAKATMAEVKQKALTNLNTASAADLAKLPGIGAARAQAIIAARPYASVEDLKKVKGIKEGVIAKLKGLVSVQ